MKMEKLFWEKQINFFWKVEIGQRYPFMFLLHLDEKIKTVWVNFNWFDMRSPRLGSLCQHENFLQFAVNVLSYAGVGPEDCVMFHWYH